jgi:hypothetical protein
MYIYLKHINRQNERVTRPPIHAYTRIRESWDFNCSYCSISKN